jgi:diguanylate cyclase (GGDEF)-like protein
MIDVDLFKQINDTYGHAAGDLVLTKIADAFREDSRNVEPLSRVGGEEFAILFECDNEESACIAAERFRNNIEGLNITIDQQRISVTISIGISVWQKSDNLDSLLNRADEALYLAKQQGRNCVILKDN